MQQPNKPRRRIGRWVALVFSGLVGITVLAAILGPTEPYDPALRPEGKVSHECEANICQFDASGSKAPAGQIVEYQWDFGDGTSGSGSNVTHEYDWKDAVYRVSLVLIDNKSHRSSGWLDVSVWLPGPKPIVFSGRGDDVSAPFTTSRTLIGTQLTHSGQDNFIIWLKSNSGQEVELIANEIGSYDGSRWFSVPPGTYILDVDADGAWEINLTQPKDKAGLDASLALAFGGHGVNDDAVGPLEFAPGLWVVDLEYSGESNFIVWLYDAKGTPLELVVNEVGDFSGRSSFAIEVETIAYIDVKAHGGEFTINFAPVE